MSFEALMPYLVILAMVYLPMIAFIGYEIWRAPLVDDDENIISDRTKRADHQVRKRASLTPAE
jgi:hypothetical protein